MLADILTIAWKESKEFSQGPSRASSIARLVFPVLIAGVLMPWREGRAYVSGPFALFGLGWILPMVAVSLTVDSIAGERERHTLESLLATRLSDEAVLYGKLAASVAYGWGMVIASLALGLVTVNLEQRTTGLLLFSPAYAAALMVVSFLGSVLVCSLAVLVSVRAPTVRQAAQTFGYGSMGVIFGTLFGLQAIPSTWWAWAQSSPAGSNPTLAAVMALVGFAAIDWLVVAAARRRFKRARLILD
jgi:ABC-2 type transport system permease protein